MRTSHRAAILGALAACLLSACASAPDTPATRTARADYPGKNRPGECYIYGNSLYREMEREGIPSWKIVFHGDLVSNGFEFAYHEVVVYRDEGKYWVVDNLNPYPSAIGGSSADEWFDTSARTWPAVTVSTTASSPCRTTMASRWPPAES